MSGGFNRDSIVLGVRREGEFGVMIRGLQGGDTWTVAGARGLHAVLGGLLEEAEARASNPAGQAATPAEQALVEAALGRVASVARASCPCPDCVAERQAAALGERTTPQVEPEVAFARAGVDVADKGAGVKVTAAAEPAAFSEEELRREAMGYAVEFYRPEAGKHPPGPEAVVAYARTLEAYLRGGPPPC